MSSLHPLLVSIVFCLVGIARQPASASETLATPDVIQTPSESAPANPLEEYVLKFVPERRPNPTAVKPGFLLFPVVSHLPGAGSTAGGGLLGRNVLGSRANFVTAATVGDLAIATAAITELHAIENRLIFGAFIYDAKIPYQYFDRGMRSGRHDFFYNSQKSYGGVGTAEFHSFESRFQLLAQVGGGRTEAARISAESGEVFDNQDHREFSTLNHLVRLRLDLTDQNLDPRRGLRIDLSRSENNLFDSNQSRFSNWSLFDTVYVPVGRSSTWAFNYSRSSAFVREHNLKSEAEVRQELGLNCSEIAPASTRDLCQKTEDQRIKDRMNENLYGSISPLGGATQLRAYPAGRLSGSQSVFYSSELRLNLTDENTPFNFLFITGARSILQLALFYELGAAGDPPERLMAHALSDYGVGVRLGFSGALVRADLGIGSEGSQFTFFFGYPWEPPLF